MLTPLPQRAHRLNRLAAIASRIAVLIYLALALGLGGANPVRHGLAAGLLALAGLIAAAALGLAARSLGASPRSGRLAVAMLSAAHLSAALGHTLSLTVGSGQPAPAWLDLFQAAYFALFIIAVLCLPYVPATRAEWVKFLLDAGLLVVSAAIVHRSFWADPEVIAHAAANAALPFALRYALVSLGLFLALVVLFLRRLTAPARPMVLLAVGITVIITSDMVAALVLLDSANAAWLSGLGQIVSYAILAQAGLLILSNAPAAEGAVSGRDWLARLPPFVRTMLVYLPYAVLAAAYLFLVWGRGQRLTLSFSALAVGVGAILLLVVARQLVSLEDSRRELRLQQYRRDADSLTLELSRRLLGATTEAVVADCAADIAAAALQIDSSLLLLTDGAEMTVRAGHGWPSGILPAVRVPAAATGAAALGQTVQPAAPDLMAEGVESGLSVPLTVEGRAVGALLVYSRTPRRFTDDDAHRLRLIANQVAAAIEKVRLFEVSRRQIDELTVLHAVATAGAAAVAEDELIARITDIVGTTLFSAHLGVMLIDQEAGLLRSHRSYHGDPSFVTPLGQGITGHVALTGQPARVDDVTTDPRFVDVEPGARSELCVPLTVAGHVIGVLNVESPRVAAFTDADERLLVTIARQLSTALERLRLFDQLYQAEQQRAGELETVRQASLGLTASLDLQAVLQSILQSTLNLLPGAQDAFIFLYTAANGGRLTFGAARSLSPHPPETWETRAGELTQAVLRQGEIVLVDDVRRHALFIGAPPEWGGAFAGVPLKIGARLVGVMNVAYPAARAFPSSEHRVLRLIGDQAAIAIENARLFEAERAAREQAEALREVAATLNANLDRERLLQVILEQLARVVAYDSASVMLFAGDRLAVVARSGVAAPAPAGLLVPLAGLPHVRAVVDGRQPVIIADTRTVTQWPAVPGGERVRAWLGVPLLAQGRLLGLLNLEQAVPFAYTDHDADLAAAFANQAGAAIETARLFEIERRQLSLAHVLQSVGSLLTAQMSLDEVIENIFDLLAQVVAYDSVSVQLVTPAGGLELAAGRGFSDMEAARENVRLLADQRGLSQWLDLPVLVISDTADDPRWIAHPAVDDVRSWIGAALIVKGNLIGLLSTDSSTPLAYDVAAGETVRAFANQAAVAIENARLFDASQRQTRVLAGLYDTALATGSVLETDVLLARWQAQVAQLLHPDVFVVAFYLPDSEELEVMVAAEVGRLAPDEAPLDRVPVNHGLLGWVTRHRQSLLVDDLHAEALPVPPRQGIRLARSWLGVPLIARDRTLGAASVQSFQPRAFEAADRRFLEAVARQVAIAIENARLYAEVSARAAELSRLYSAAQDLGANLEPRAVLEQLARHLTESVDATSGYVSEVNLAAETLTVLGEYWAASAPPEERRIDLGRAYRLRDLPATYRAVTRLVIVEVQQGSPLLSPAERATMDAHGLQSALLVPIVSRGEVLGLAEIWESRRSRSFSLSERRLLYTLCQHAAGVIQNARLFAEAVQHAEEVTAASEILHLLNSAGNVIDSFPAIAAALKSITACDRVSLATYDELRFHVTIQALDRNSTTLPPGTRFPVTDTAATADVLAGRIHLTPALDEEAAFPAERRLLDAGYHSRLSLPLRVGADVIGTVNLVWRLPSGFAQANLPLLTQVADALALAIEKTRLAEATRRRDVILEALAYSSGRLLSAVQPDDVMPELLAQLGLAAGVSRAYIAANHTLPTGDLAASLRYTWIAPDLPAAPVHPQWEAVPYRAGGLERWLETLSAGRTLAGLVRDFPLAERQHFEPSGVLSLAVVPIFSSGAWWGWLCFDDVQVERVWPSAEIEALRSAASALGAFLTRQVTEAAEREQRALAEALRDTAAALNSTLDQDEVLDRILADVGFVVPHTSANIMLVQDDVARVVRNRDVQGRYPVADMLAVQYPVTDVPNLAHMLATGEPAIVSDSRTFPGWQDRPENRHIRSVVGAPIQIKGVVIGFITLDSTEPGFYTPAHAERLQAFAHQAGLAIENAQLYASIRRHADELEQRVVERTRELDDANRRLLELDRLKDQFISNVSHELRTPLTNIKLHLGLLEKRGPDVLGRYLPTLQRETERLRRLIEDLLDLSRLQTQNEPLHREPLPLDELLSEVLTLHTARAEAKGLSLRFYPHPDLPLVPADRAQLIQVFTNLIGNAVAYTPSGGHAIVSTTLDQVGGASGVTVHFFNNGPPIPPEDRPHLFRRFYRGRTANDSGEPGTGLGLAICREIVERHGGQIDVRSDQEQGTVFTVWLPLT